MIVGHCCEYVSAVWAEAVMYLHLLVVFTRYRMKALAEMFVTIVCFKFNQKI